MSDRPFNAAGRSEKHLPHPDPYMNNNEKIRISAFPNPFPGNPYLTIFYSALEKHGVEYVRSDYFGQEWLRQNRGAIDIIHFHWVGTFYEDAKGRISFRRLMAFLLKISFARLLGYRVVWTMHNLYPHNRPRGWKAWLCRFLFLHAVNAVFVTFKAAGTDIARLFGRRRNVFLLPHGNYQDVYPKIPTRSAARLKLGLPDDAFIFFLFGGISPYKGAHTAIQAMDTLRDRNIRLVVMGQCLLPSYEEEIRRLAENNPAVTLHVGKEDVPDDEVCLWMAAIDCVLAPYDDIYTSGMLYLAATFGKPIIAPRIGIFEELVEAPFVYLYEKHAVDTALPHRMIKASEDDVHRVTAAARAFTDAHHWSDITRQTARDLSTVLGR